MSRTRRVVPYRRQIKRGARGRDVIAVKRALSRSGLLPWAGWGFTTTFGPLAVSGLKKFQARVKLKQDGVYGPATHAALARHRHKGVQAFDAYSVFLLQNLDIKTPEEKRRDAVVAAAMFGYNNRAQISYTQSGSRMEGVRNRLVPPRFGRWEDCSSWATFCYYVADRLVGGVPNPNGVLVRGEKWPPYGYTGTFVDNGRVVSWDDTKPGDCLFYGRRAIPAHMAIYVGQGRAVGHGSESGPNMTARSYRSDYSHARSYI